MKRLSILIILFFFTHAMSQEEVYPLKKDFNVYSDQSDESIEKGKFVVEGHVKMFSSANPLEKVMVVAESAGDTITAMTDSTGYFSMTIEANDPLLSFVKKGWSKVVIDDYLFSAGHRIKMTVYMGQVRRTESKARRKK